MTSRCRFERRTLAPDDYGNVTDGSWSELMTVWGSLHFESARERMEAGRRESAARATLWIHSSVAARAITAADRVTIDGAAFAIYGLIEAPEGGQIRLDLEKGVAA